MFYALGPGEIRDVDETVDAFFDFDEHTEVGELADAALDHRADAVASGDGGPRVGLELFDSERDAAILRLHIQHHGFHLIADFDDLARVLHPPAPGHFGD